MVLVANIDALMTTCSQLSSRNQRWSPVKWAQALLAESDRESVGVEHARDRCVVVWLCEVHLYSCVARGFKLGRPVHPPSAVGLATTSTTHNTVDVEVATPPMYHLGRNIEQ